MTETDFLCVMNTLLRFVTFALELESIEKVTVDLVAFFLIHSSPLFTLQITVTLKYLLVLQFQQK